MQTYGNFFNPPKTENQIVDKWRIVGGEKLLYKIYKHVFCAALVFSIHFRQGYSPGCGRKNQIPGLFFGLFDLYNVK